MKQTIGKKVSARVRRFLLEVPAKQERGSLLARYGIAALCVFVAFAIRYFLDPVLRPHATFILFVPAIILSAWYGGIGPSIAVILSAFLLTNYFFLVPRGSLGPISVSELTAVATYIFSSAVVIGLMNVIRSERGRVMAKADELLAQTKRLEQEIERREQAEMQVRESEQRLEAIINFSPLMIFLKDLQGRYLLSNNEFEIITHQPAEKIVGKSDYEIFPFEQASAFRSNDAEVFKAGVPMDFEEIAQHDDGPHTSIVHKFPLRDLTGNVYALGGIVTDITQRKRDEEVLRKARQNYADLVNNIDGIVWEADPTTPSFTFVSQKAERLLGYPIELWRTKGFWTGHLHPDDREWAVSFCQEQIRKKRDHDYEYRMVAADGSTVWLRDIVSVKVENSGRIKLRGIMVDITAQKEAERALQESERKYHSLYNNTPVMLHSIGADGELLSVSNFWLNTMGYQRNEVIGRKSLEFLTPQSQTYAREVVLPEFFKNGVCRDVPYQMVKKNAEIIDVLISAIAEKDVHGKVVRSMAVIVDVTDRKRAERALKTSEERLRILAETAVDAIVSADIYGKIVQFNPAAERIFGRAAADMLGASVSVLMPERYRDACHRGIQQFLATGTAELIGTTVELAGLRNDGAEFPLELSLSAWENSEGKFFTAVVRDITERKQTQETIRRNEELLRMTTEAANIYVWDWDIVNDRLESSGMARMASKKVPLSSRQIEEFAPPEDRARIWKEVEMCLRENRELNIEYRVLWADGSLHWQLSRGRPFYENGRAVRLRGISMDITERKNAEEALRQSEALLRMTTEAANVHVWNWNILSNVIECPQLMARIIGQSNSVSLDEFLDYLQPEDRGPLKEALDRSLREKSEFNAEYRIRWNDGSIHWQLSRGQPFFDDGRAIRLSGVSIDFTARRNAEEALRQSEALLRMTTDGANIGLWSWDIEKGTVEWNPAEYRQFGIPYGKPMDFNMFLLLIHPDDRALFRDEIERCLRENRELNVEHRILHPDGAVRWNQCKGSGFYRNGRAVRFSGMSLDITDRKQAQEALRRQAELLNLAQVLVFDMNDTILFWNHESEKLYGYTRTEALGKNRLELLHSEAAISQVNVKERLLRDGSWSGELLRRRKNGERIIVAVNWVLYKDEQNRPLMVLESSNDITALKKTEADLQQAQLDLALHAQELERRVQQRTEELQRSLKDMETFCYTIAHDLRAPLRAMSGFTYSLAEDFSPQLGAVGIDYCRRINAASARMSQLISDLLVYGRLSHRELPVQSVDLLAEINKVLERSAQQIGERNAEIQVDKPLPQVCGDAPLIDQILENLLSNAVKFVPPDRRPRIHIYAEHHDHSIRLCIEDNGIGIPEEQRQKIFEPFQRLHTEEYPGTGIGLAIVQRGVEKMGGNVGVESTPESGSRFWVELPEHCERG